MHARKMRQNYAQAFVLSVLFIVVTGFYFMSHHLNEYTVTITADIRPADLEAGPCPSLIDEIVFQPSGVSPKMPMELEKVVPIWKNITADKCIGKIKPKSRRKFSTQENDTFYGCVERNKNVNGVRDHSMHRYNRDRSIIYSYFKMLKMKPDVAIIEIGGYLGGLMAKLVETTGTKRYVVLEPVPSFYKRFTKKVEDLSLKSTVTAYSFGLAKTPKELQIAVHAEATSLLRDDIRKGVKTETIKIFNVIDFFVQIGLGCHSLNLLTINCEGCEFDVIEMLTSTSLIDNIDYVQFQPHAIVFTDQQEYICKYCRLRQLLARTHEVGYEFPHVWETWKRKGLS